MPTQTPTLSAETFVGHERIDAVLSLVRSLSGAKDPLEVQFLFGRGWRKLYSQEDSGYLSLSTRGLAPGEYRITRFLPEGLPDDDEEARRITWPQNALLPVHTGGLIGQLIAEPRPTLIRELDVPDDPAVGGMLAEFNGLLALPLFDRGEALNWSIQLFRTLPDFADFDIAETLLRANLVGGTVKQVLTAQQLREAQERTRGEVQRIAEIQRALLPDRLPSIPGVELAASYQTFDQAGGDFYFFHEIGTDPVNDVKPPDGTWGFLVGDVSGHGPAAAVVMAMVETLIGAYHGGEGGVAHFFEYLNRHLCAKRIEDAFVTAWGGIYDPATGRFEYGCAGHPPPLVRHTEPAPGTEPGCVTILPLDQTGGLPLGILPDEAYATATATLEPGDTLVMYTDGITEARAPGGDFFGTSGIVEALTQCSGSPGCAIDTIGNAMRTHEAGARPQDDQTLVVMRRNG